MRMLRPSPLHLGPIGTRALATIFNAQTEELLGTVCKTSEEYQPPIHVPTLNSAHYSIPAPSFPTSQPLSVTRGHGLKCFNCGGNLLLYIRNSFPWTCEYPAHKEANKFTAHDIPYFCPANCRGNGSPWMCCQSCFSNESNIEYFVPRSGFSYLPEKSKPILPESKLRQLEYRRRYYLNRRLIAKQKLAEHAAATAAASTIATSLMDQIPLLSNTELSAPLSSLPSSLPVLSPSGASSMNGAFQNPAPGRVVVKILVNAILIYFKYIVAYLYILVSIT